jgi:hypothetical protein
VTRWLWEEAWINVEDVKRYIPSPENERFKSPIHVIARPKVSLAHSPPFGCLMYVALDKA